jgi:hypothetical protein
MCQTGLQQYVTAITSSELDCIFISDIAQQAHEKLQSTVTFI